MNADIKKEKAKEDIYSYLKQGMFKKDAAVMAGISEKTFYRWIEEDDSFDSRVEASILEYKHSLIKVMTQQAEKNGTLALKILQARWPKEWGNSHGGEEEERKVVRPVVVSDIRPWARNSPIEPQNKMDGKALYISDV